MDGKSVAAGNGPLPGWLRDWQYAMARQAQVHQLAAA